MGKCSITVTLAILGAGCAGPAPSNGDPVERYGAYCESLGNPRGSERFRACIDTQELNAGIAGAKREYDRKLIRSKDCVDPRFSCDTPTR